MKRLLVLLMLFVPLSLLGTDLNTCGDYQVSLYDFLGVDSSASDYWTPARVRRAISNAVRFVQHHGREYEQIDTIRTDTDLAGYILPAGITTHTLDAVTQIDRTTHDIKAYLRRVISDFGKQVPTETKWYDVRGDSIYFYPTPQTGFLITLHWHNYDGDLTAQADTVHVEPGHRYLVLDMAEAYCWRMRQKPDMGFQYRNAVLQDLLGIDRSVPKVPPGALGLEGQE